MALLVTRQSTAHNAPIKDCATADHVMVKVDLLLIFHVEEPESFIYRLGAERFEDRLMKESEEIAALKQKRLAETEAEKYAQALANLLKVRRHSRPTGRASGL